MNPETGMEASPNTVAAPSTSSSTPPGTSPSAESIYVRFASRDELPARPWLRSIRRFHASFVTALTGPAPLLSAATFLPHYCRAHPCGSRRVSGPFVTTRCTKSGDTRAFSGKPLVARHQVCQGGTRLRRYPVAIFAQIGITAGEGAF
jgi:hypothetical protein